MKINASSAVLLGCDSNICKGHHKVQQDQKAKVRQVPSCVFAKSYFNLSLPDVGQQQFRCGNKVVNEERYG